MDIINTRLVYCIKWNLKCDILKLHISLAAEMKTAVMEAELHSAFD